MVRQFEGVKAAECAWCGGPLEIDDVDDAPVCELRGCEARFCGVGCVDFHMGKHEDDGDCVRDREGVVVTGAE